MDWLGEVTAHIAERTGADAAALSLDPATRRAILDVARIASHASGDRINAPLLCYALGLAAARGGALADAIAAVREKTGDVD